MNKLNASQSAPNESTEGLRLKEIQIAFAGNDHIDGDGAAVKGFIGGKQVRTLDPFLMIGLFDCALPAGFPDHPHRGFETVTYMLSGV